MRSARLVPRRLLDARPTAIAAAAPIRDAVNIPLAELPLRMHELPPISRPIQIAEVDDSARAAAECLTERGRTVACVRGFESGADAPDEIGRLWEPTPFLSDVIAELHGSTVLELACGTGRDAIFLASYGWRVTAVDILPDALERAARLAARCAPAIQPIEWRVLDLEAGDVQIRGTFDLITAFRYLHRPLVPRFHEWLNPGGVLVYETFTALHRARYGKPAGDAHVLLPGELRKLFIEYEIRRYAEDWHGAAHTARIVAARRN
jgi:tellurite methyltransferase